MENKIKTETNHLIKFAVLSKDWKDIWNSDKEKIKYLESLGLTHSSEYNGDNLGVDSHFLLMTSEELTEEEIHELLYAFYLDIMDEDKEEWDYLQNYDEEKSIMRLKNGKTYFIAD